MSFGLNLDVGGKREAEYLSVKREVKGGEKGRAVVNNLIADESGYFGYLEWNDSVSFLAKVTAR